MCVTFVRFSNACVGILVLGKSCKHHSFFVNFQFLSSNVTANEQARKVIVNGIRGESTLGCFIYNNKKTPCKVHITMYLETTYLDVIKINIFFHFQFHVMML